MTQEEALSILKTGLNVFLTGEPGSGKTHTINRYIVWLRDRGIEAAITASTGIAATHIGGMTVHSWSGIGVKRNLSEYDIDLIRTREKTVRRIVDAKVLIIDEISMLDAGTLASVDRLLRDVRSSVLPFGGVQIVFVGDFFQLPPVSTRSSRGEPVSSEKNAAFAFESASWRAANPVVCYLEEQHRQEDADFLDLLGALRRRELTDAHLGRLQSRVGILSKREVATRLYTHNEHVDRINKESLDAIEGEMRVYRMTSRGPQRLVETLKNQCLSPEELTLKEGAAVMFTRNNFEAGYVNGSLGTVTGFSSLGLPLVVLKSGRAVTVEQAEWAIQDGGKILARLVQLPLRLAWAITVHKSQGLSLESAVIDLSRAFEYGQGYVALSRVRTLSGLFLEGFNERSLELHPTVAAADRGFRAYSAAASKKFAALPEKEKRTLEERFLKAIGAKDPKQVAAQKPAKSSIELLREKYPNVGKPWSKEDDALLTELFKEDAPNAAIAKRFGRKPSAIHARLGHLGLIEDTWKPKGK